MTRRKLEGCRAIVTGASSGIGRALVLELARNKSRVIATARREERLAELVAEARTAGGDVSFVAGDLTLSETRQALVAAARERLGGLDLLVNNAGVGSIRDFAISDGEGLRKVMEANFFATVEMTRAAFPLLRAGRAPMVVNVTSILAHRGIPHYSEYCASKFAVQGFSEAMRAERASHGVDVLVVSPGPTQSEFWNSLAAEQPGVGSRGEGAVSAEHVARATVRAIRAGRHEIIPSFKGRWLVRLDRISPRLADAMVARFG